MSSEKATRITDKQQNQQKAQDPNIYTVYRYRHMLFMRAFECTSVSSCLLYWQIGSQHCSSVSRLFFFFQEHDCKRLGTLKNMNKTEYDHSSQSLTSKNAAATGISQTTRTWCSMSPLVDEDRKGLSKSVRSSYSQRSEAGRWAGSVSLPADSILWLCRKMS